MKKVKIALFLTVLAMASFIAYGSDLFLIITDRDLGTAVESCSVYVDTGGVVYDTLVTTSSGMDSIQSLQNGVIYGLTFNKIGYSPDTIRFFNTTVGGDETLAITLSPIDSGTITLTLFDLVEGDTIPGVMCISDTGGKVLDTVYTDSLGQATFHYASDSVYICFNLEDTLGGYWPIDSLCIWAFPDSFHINLLIPFDPLLGYTGIYAFQNFYDGTRCEQTAVDSCLCSLFTTGGSHITSGYTDSTGWLAVGDTFSAMSAGSDYDARCHKDGDTVWTSTETRKEYLGRGTVWAVEIDSMPDITSWPVQGRVTRFGKKIANAEVQVYMNDRGWYANDGTYDYLIGAGQSVWTDAYIIYTDSNGLFKTFVADSTNIKVVIPTVGYNRSYLVTDTLNLGDVKVP